MGDPAAVPAPADNTQTTSILAGLSSEQKPAAPAPAPQQDEPAKTPAPAATGTWRDRLPDDLKAHASLSKFETEEGLAKSYVNLERMLGGDKVPVPKDAEDKEGWDRFYAAAGRPEKPEDYKLERPSQLPEGVSVDEAGETFLKQFAHQNGWNQRQFDAAYKTFLEREQQKVAAWSKSQRDSYDEGMRALQLTGNKDEILNLAAATKQQYFDDDAVARLDAAGLGNDPVIIRALAKIGKDLTGHQVLKGRGGEPVKTVDQIKNDIGEFRKVHNTALMDKTHPEHDARTKELEGMYQRAYPENAA